MATLEMQPAEPVESVPSRRNSGISAHTGVASHSDVATDEEDEVSEVITNPSDEEASNLKRSLHLHKGSLGTEALTMKRLALGVARGTKGNYSGDEGGYDGSEDGEGDEELSEDEYSNPSEEERAKRRAQVRSARRAAQAAPTRTLPAFEEAGVVPRRPAPSEEEEVLFQAPSDVDRSPMVENVETKKGDHRVTSNFSFPPKTPPRLLPPTRGVGSLLLEPTPSIARLDLSSVTTPPSPALPAPKPLNVAAPEFVFGGKAPLQKPELNVVTAPPTFGRKSSTASLGSASIGPFGGPGSLAVSPTLVEPSPRSASLSPFVQEFTPSSFKATNPDPITEDDPSPPLTKTVALEGSSTFDFKPPAEAPTLPAPAPPPLNRNPSSRGPLPLIPLTSIQPHSASVKRQKVSADLDQPHVHFSGSSTASLRRPPPRDAQESDADEVAVAIAEQSIVGTPGGDDPLPEQYAPAQTLGRSFTASGRPFTLRPAASFSADGRVVGFSTARRGAIPQFGVE